MKKIIFYIAALSLIAAACNKAELNPVEGGEETTPAENMIIETVSATTEMSTKATIANTGGAFAWTAGEHIAVHVSNGTTHKYVLTSDTGGSGASAAAGTASFTIAYDEGYARDAFAVYPRTIVSRDAANYGQSGATLDVTLPSSYTLAQVSGETTPCPMIATNAPSSGWTFHQLCGLLRLTVNGIPPSTSYLTIDFNDKKVQGDFSIEDPVIPGTSTIATSATTDPDDIITITDLGITGWTDGLVLNIPLPTGNYTDVSVTAYNSSDVAIHHVTNDFSYLAKRATGRKVTASLPFISVSADKKVIFAPGNLQYLGSAGGTGTWRFAEHQYDFMGDGPSSGTSYQGNVAISGFTKYNASADKDVARDLFGWGTSGFENKYPYMTSTNTGSYYSGSLTDTDYDWGVYHSASGTSSEKITNGGDYSWRLFTSDEWCYVVNRERRVYTREDYMETKKLFAAATVVGVKGIIIFPDNWDGSLCKTIKYQNESGVNYDGVICDAEKWAQFEKVGCVFLPAAHVRSGTSFLSTLLNEGNYWASTVQPVLSGTEYRGGTLQFTNTGAVILTKSNNQVRYFGQSVRLIRDVE